MDFVQMGHKIKRARKAQRITQTDLAQQIGLSPSFIGQIERGEKAASLETLEAICNALNVSADYLLGLSA